MSDVSPAAACHIRYTSDDVRYDPIRHVSWLPDGRDVPHVTRILEAVGVTMDFAALADRNGRLASVIELAGARGTAVHADCHALDDDDLICATVDPRVWPYVEAWATCKADKGLVPIAHARERHVFHSLHTYAGILDAICLRDGRRILVDLKTGDPAAAAAHLQTAAYELAWLAEHSDHPIDARWAIWLRPGRRVPYSIIDYTAWPASWQHGQTFLACLTVFREQPVSRLR